jgi:hypothetical protein
MLLLVIWNCYLHSPQEVLPGCANVSQLRLQHLEATLKAFTRTHHSLQGTKSTQMCATQHSAQHHISWSI